MSLLALAQVVALIVVCARLVGGRRRVPFVDAREDGVAGASVSWRWFDALLLILAQALPIPVLLALALGVLDGGGSVMALVAVNGALITVRILLTAATAHSFARRGLAFGLSPLADVAAVLRVVETMAHRPREWRGEPRSLAATS